MASTEDGIGSATDRLQHEYMQQQQQQQQQLLSPKILIMQPILRFLQLLCENHNRDLQACLDDHMILDPFITNNS